ncbi:MAG: HAD family hydrolase [Mesorhizobium sp.]|nr:MAG: HAD family hydrolase [Mesorhizobium sp.]RWL92270.1 MAG: HAD family hydrolase [Mesorhizobium sp.]
MTGPPANSNVLFVDADNTLWDTDRVFAGAQLSLLEAVETAVARRANVQDKLGFVRMLDQMLAERHHAGLRYPPRLLAQATGLALRGVKPDRAVRLAWAGAHDQQQLVASQAEAIEATFISAISSLPPLRPGVAEGLEVLHAAGCMILIVTEGHRAKVAQTASAHDLNKHIDRIIEAPKHSRLFERVQLLKGSSSRGFMVGDQLERDIRPAKEAGLTTIYFPGGFRPRWETNPNIVQPDYQISSFAEVPTIVLGNAGPAQQHG